MDSPQTAVTPSMTRLVVDPPTLWLFGSAIRSRYTISIPSILVLATLSRSCLGEVLKTHPVSFCLTMPPDSPVCLPVLPPSTTSLSSWKNWLTTVCLCCRVSLMHGKASGSRCDDEVQRCRASGAILGEVQSPHVPQGCARGR